MENNVNIKKMSRVNLEESYEKLNTLVEQLSMENTWYKELIKLQQKKLYGKSSEKTNDDQLELLLVFDEAEIESTPINDETNIKVMPHSRKKKSKQMSLDGLDNKVIHYELTDDELDCPTCNNQMHEMSKHVRKELIFVPAKVEVINHVEHIYSCRHCEMHSDEATIIKANSPKPLIKGSLVSASLLASIINDKYDKSLPLYRQEVSFNRLGININRQNMSNWLIKASNDYFKPMIDYMYRQLLKMQYISADETTVQVLNEPGKAASAKSYMWCYVSGRSEEKQMVIYNYEPSRAHKHAIDYLKDYSGILLTDGYQAYDNISNITQAGCWAHARRKFKETLELVPKTAKKEDTQTYKLYQMINELFKIEKENKNKSYDEITNIRQTKSLLIVDEFFTKIHELEKIALPKSHFGIAIKYASNQENKLRTYLNDGRVEISNNITERVIRNFTIGRNNWVFMNTVKGANSSGYIYSLVESAKLNNLKPYDYFNYILNILPTLDLKNDEILNTIMPWSKLPEELYNTKKS